MWNLIKYEIRYLKNELMMAYGVLVFMFIFIHFIPDIPPQETVPNEGLLMFMLLIAFIFQLSVTRTFQIREKSTRRLMLLPLTTWNIGVARIISSNLCWFGLLTLFLILPRLSRHFPFDGKTVLSVCSFSGLIFILNAFMFLNQDLHECIHPREEFFKISVKKLTNLLVTILSTLGIVLYFMLYFGLVGRISEKPNRLLPGYIYSGIVLSKTGAILLLLLGLGLSAFSVWIFQRRRSYVE
jgi:hypothetical protein